MCSSQAVDLDVQQEAGFKYMLWKCEQKRQVPHLFIYVKDSFIYYEFDWDSF